MKLAVSNMAWSSEQDEAAYALMKKYGIQGLEILPTKIIPGNPYDHIDEIKAWRKRLTDTYGFQIPSMQSIWYGRTEQIFGTEAERQTLLDYTRKAILFAEAAGCRNLVFGCPRNRAVPAGRKREEGILFFRKIAEYAALHHTVIGMEANPPIYHTNYINTTAEALELVDQVDRSAFMLNFDFGTLVENREDLSVLEGRIAQISHVHISEPHLKPICRRTEHESLCRLLKKAGYQGYLSIEMSAAQDMAALEEVMAYVAEIAGE